jgi:acyl-CoA reductase-like NAD-dependent aldehyde dehydrogenase
MPQHQQLFIGGHWRDAAGGATHDVVNAFTGEVATTQATAGPEDVDAAVTAAADALPGWAATDPAQRAEVLRAAGDLLGGRAQEIAAIVAEETGGTFGWGMFNVGLAADILRAAGDVAGQVADEPVDTAVPGLESLAVRRPLGVCVAIAPWNAPVILGTRSVAWPLAFGNTVVFKASEQSPRVHAAIVSALADAGLPAGALNLITNDPADAPEVVGRLIDDPRTAHINFTGSTRVGRVIAQRAAGQFKRTLLELGGKAPFVVLDDADLDAAVAAANFGAFMNSGQICMSTERIVVAEPIADAFTAKLVERAQGLTVGSPFEQTTMVGPVVTAAAGAHVTELIEDARAHGASVVGGEAHDGDALLSPAVVAGVTPQMRIYGEESFGPVVTVITARDDDDAVRIANDTEYGLSAAVFGADLGRARSVAERIQSGICHINGSTVHDEAAAPFGGVKASGWGRFGAGEVAEEFTTRRWITISHEPRHYPI